MTGAAEPGREDLVTIRGGDLDQVYAELTSRLRGYEDTPTVEGARRPCCFNLSACTDPDLSKNGRLLEPGDDRPSAVGGDPVRREGPVMRG